MLGGVEPVCDAVKERGFAFDGANLLRHEAAQQVSSFGISLLMAVSFVGGNDLCIRVFIECRKLDERHIDFDTIPFVEAAYDAVHGEKEVVVRFLKGLGYGVQLSLVRAGVVGLRLAGYSPDKIRVDAEREVYHVDRLLNVALPVAALLSVVNPVDYDIVHLIAVGVDVKC